MKLLVDNDLPPRLGRGLGALFAGEHHVEHMKDKFGTGSLLDAEWIERLGKEGGWCVLSGDRRIAKQKPSRDLFLRAGLIGFFALPTVRKMPFNEQTARILIMWPAMTIMSETIAQGCFELPIKGRLRQMA
ncbi:hypothetical protein [Sphingomonas sp. VDB2]|uniref:PIN-like domain-containing protein n=1 Tax=Sphingomonas sp. VDB2 TaxID=3228751 RepID=UPI003A80CFAB